MFKLCDFGCMQEVIGSGISAADLEAQASRQCKKSNAQQALQRLVARVRVCQLGPAYLNNVLPALDWFSISTTQLGLLAQYRSAAAAMAAATAAGSGAPGGSGSQWLQDLDLVQRYALSAAKAGLTATKAPSEWMNTALLVEQQQQQLRLKLAGSHKGGDVASALSAPCELSLQIRTDVLQSMVDEAQAYGQEKSLHGTSGVVNGYDFHCRVSCWAVVQQPVNLPGVFTSLNNLACFFGVLRGAACPICQLANKCHE